MIADLYEIRKSSRYGKGQFATQFVPKGTIDVFRCAKCGAYSKEEFAKLPKKERDFVVSHEVMNEDGLYSKFCDKRMQYDNHSCDANTLSVGGVFGIVVSDIKKGEEATSDYRQNEEEIHFAGGCMCGGKNCMGRSTFKPPASKKIQSFWNRRISAALKRIPYVKQPLKRQLLKEHPELSYYFKKSK